MTSSASELTRYLQRLLRVKYLHDDAKADVQFMLKLHDSGTYRMDRYSPVVLLYPFLANPHSEAGKVLRSCLKGFSGDLFQRLADEDWSNFYEDEEPEAIALPYPFAEGAIRRASEYLREPLHSGDFLSAAMIYPMPPSKTTELDVERERKIYADLRRRTPITAERISRADSEIASFLYDRGIDPNIVAMRLRGYAHPQNDPESIVERFSLAVRLLASGRIKVEVVERWGEHSIADAANAIPQPHGLWLPETVLFLPSEIEEFEQLLNARPPASESLYQQFFESHPKWLYLLGEQYEAVRSQIHLPPVQYKPELALYDGPVEEMTLRPDFLLKRVGLDLWDVLDIKPSTFQTVVGRTSRRRFSESVSDAIAQLREYHRRLQQNEVRAFLRNTHQMSVAEPVAMVLIGRDFDFKNLREKSALREQGQVRVYTYDDLHRLASHRRLAL